MKVALTTIGCRFNQFETAEMEELFKSGNFEIVPFASQANIYVINTCTVTKKSDYQCRQTIRKAIKKNRDAFVIVTGCYSQTNPYEIGLIEGVDMILGNTDKLNILKHIKDLNIKKSGKPEIIVRDISNTQGFNSLTVSNFSGRTSAYLKVQTGCNQRCSFCIVVIARGPSISERPEIILRQAERLTEAGYKEIVLTGVNLGNYGSDIRPPLELSDLIEMLTNVKDIERIRLSSINPKEITDRLISVIKKSDKVCRHLHIPLQSGDDDILKKMRRNYNSEFYKNLIIKLKDEMPDIGIGADVMVGFPGEDEIKFNNTYKLINELPFSYLHVFTYSPRGGTDAYGYNCHLPEPVKKERNLIIKNLVRLKSDVFRRNFIGKICRVLIENSRDRETGMLKGYTDNYIPVLLEGKDKLMNKLINIRITGLSADAVAGELIDENK